MKMKMKSFAPKIINKLLLENVSRWLGLIICITLTGIIVYSISLFVNVNYYDTPCTFYTTIKIYTKWLLGINPGLFSYRFKCIVDIIFYGLIFLGINFIQNIKFVFLSILAFIFSYAFLKDFKKKHSSSLRRGKIRKIINLFFLLLENFQMLMFYLMFFFITFIFRGIIRKSINIMFGEQDKILCYILVILLSITFISYIANLLIKFLNSLFLSRNPKWRELGPKIDKITKEDFYLFNPKVIDSITIYNCVYIIVMFYISQRFTIWYFSLITFFLILFLIIWVKKNLVSFPISKDAHTLRSGIPVTTLTGVIGGAFCVSHLNDWENSGIAEARDFKFAKEAKPDAQIYISTGNGDGKKFTYFRPHQAQAFLDKVNNTDSKILKLVRGYENETKRLSFIFNIAMDYELKGLCLDDKPFKWILGYISFPKTYVLTLFMSDEPKFTIDKNNIYYPTYFMDNSTINFIRHANTSYSTDMKLNRVENIIAITPGKMITLGNMLNIVEVPRPYVEYTIEPIIHDIPPLKSCMDFINEKNQNRACASNEPQNNGKSLDYTYNPIKAKMITTNTETPIFRLNSSVDRITRDHEKYFSTKDLRKISWDVINSYFLPLFLKLGDTDLYPNNDNNIFLFNSNENYDTFVSRRSPAYIQFQTGHFNSNHGKAYTCEFDANKGLFANFKKPNLTFTQKSLDQKRLSFFDTQAKASAIFHDRKFAVHIADNYMEFLHIKSIKGQPIICSIAFPEKCYIVNYSYFDFHHPLLIYNIFNSNFQLNKFLEYVYSNSKNENSELTLTPRFLNYDENKLKELYNVKLDKKYRVVIENSLENNKEFDSLLVASAQQPRQQPENNICVASEASNASANASNTEIEDIYDVSDRE